MINWACSENLTASALSPVLLRVISLWLVLFDLFVIFGNFLVIYVVCRFKRLRNVPGIMIASLATTDLSLGLFVLPFSTTNQLLGIWIFGEIWCQVWLLIDVLLCTASIYHLVVISCDRCIAVTKPLSYPQIMTKKRGKIVCACVWLFALFISVPPLLPSLGSVVDQLPLENAEKCTCTPMNNSPTYIVLSAIGSFYIPLLIIAGFYLKIYQVLRDVRKRNQMGTLTPNTGQKNCMESPRVHVGRYSSPTIIEPETQTPESGQVTSSLNSIRKPVASSLSLPDRESQKNNTPFSRKLNRSKILMAIDSIGIGGKDGTQGRRKRLARNLSREIQAAKMVAIVVGCFVFCWIGFAVCYLMEAFPSCNGQQKCVPDLVFSIVFWLGYGNSGKN